MELDMIVVRHLRFCDELWLMGVPPLSVSEEWLWPFVTASSSPIQGEQDYKTGAKYITVLLWTYVMKMARNTTLKERAVTVTKVQKSKLSTIPGNSVCLGQYQEPCLGTICSRSQKCKRWSFFASVGRIHSTRRLPWGMQKPSMNG